MPAAELALPPSGVSAPASAVEGAAPPSAPVEVPPESDLTSGVEAPTESLGWMLMRTLVVFGGVMALIYLTLNVGLRKLMGLQGVPVGQQSVVSVVERLALDQRRTLFVVKAAGEYLLVGGGENGLQLLSKLDTGAVENIRSAPPPSNVMPLSPFLKKLIARRDATPPGSTPPSVPRPPDAA
ncbi:Flagellar biosynthesis protein FliO [Cystobacter fuscus DSM 2262]|uniref:Flagellar biosynthesis protein FliO n=1 Tax=Cystobacter fuscus (strain ATCC 25194 / DSM 2262 / NBRC 100088 / M29) TaxID=1242864 RepID=S9QNH7_CYSF2|nr:flagellar biosynthetic protein FliO [Cystobacter fuscus]EPX58083.1 Flagellar biosynthesis protein FliO [Cystobacter fuscus DSM 2262]